MANIMVSDCDRNPYEMQICKNLYIREWQKLEKVGGLLIRESCLNPGS